MNNVLCVIDFTMNSPTICRFSLFLTLSLFSPSLSFSLSLFLCFSQTHILHLIISVRIKQICKIRKMALFYLQSFFLLSLSFFLSLPLFLCFSLSHILHLILSVRIKQICKIRQNGFISFTIFLFSFSLLLALSISLSFFISPSRTHILHLILSVMIKQICKIRKNGFISFTIVSLTYSISPSLSRHLSLSLSLSLSHTHFISYCLSSVIIKRI
jgi:hypothetical protein